MSKPMEAGAHPEDYLNYFVDLQSPDSSQRQIQFLFEWMWVTLYFNKVHSDS